MKQVCVVTGGTRGIGAAISIALAEKGYTVIANYHQGKEAADAFSKTHNIKTLSWDVSDFSASEKALQTIEETYGAIDVLVHNAGITRDGFFHKMAPDMWHTVLQTNLSSCFNVTRPIIEGMRNRGFGRIVYISSVNGLKGQMGQTNYCAAKAGVIGFCKALAQENATKGITVNVIAPGYVETDMVKQMPEAALEKVKAQIPVGRLATANEIARCVTFLCDPSASFITGETLSVNGGQYMA